MASATVTLYKSTSGTVEFSLVTTGKEQTTYRVAGRSLATPLSLEITRKIGPSGASANDHVIVKLTQVERNETSQKLATASATLDISIPRDTTAVSTTKVIELLGMMSSMLNEGATIPYALNRTALVDGRDV